MMWACRSQWLEGLRLWSRGFIIVATSLLGKSVIFVYPVCKTDFLLSFFLWGKRPDRKPTNRIHFYLSVQLSICLAILMIDFFSLSYSLSPHDLPTPCDLTSAVMPSRQIQESSYLSSNQCWKRWNWHANEFGNKSWSYDPLTHVVTVCKSRSPTVFIYGLWNFKL